MKNSKLLQIKISLKGSDPLIWRRIQIPSRLTLKKLHEILQIVMGWRNAHLHQFVVLDKRYSEPDFEIGEYDEEGDEPVGDTSRFKISDIAKKVETFEYQYDFGDGWCHELQIEKILEEDDRVSYPICIGGEQACPPEDCGGLGGYYNFLSELSNPNDPEHDSSLRWVGGYFDPKAFDPNHINREHLWRKRW
jgi:hypothetical protein